MLAKQRGIVISAWQLNSKTTIDKIPHWVKDHLYAQDIESFARGVWSIDTFGGNVRASDGDYIVLYDDSPVIYVYPKLIFNLLYESGV